MKSVQVVITGQELRKAAAPWPGASLDNRLAELMKAKGLKLRVSVDPKPGHLLPPFRLDEDMRTGDWTIWQSQAE